MEEEKTKKPIYKKFWFWLIVGIIIIGIVGSQGDSAPTATNNIAKTDSGKIEENNQKTQIDNTIKPESKKEIAIIDFSTMSYDDIKNWCREKNMKCSKKEDYSDTIEKGNFIKQSISPNTVAYEGYEIIITYSLGRKPTNEEKNALKKAESYSKTMHMSKQKIYEQLTSEYGEGFTAEAAQYAIDNIQTDWNANALEKAKSYQSTMSMSKQKIYEQLTSEYGENFTKEEAQYAIDHLED